MIHAIYIYFIINAFIAGAGHNWKECLRDILFGLPYHIADIAWSWIKPALKKIDNKIFITAFFTVWFTNKFSDIRPNFVKERYKVGNWFERKLIQQIDKKYKYGITTEKPIY